MENTEIIGEEKAQLPPSHFSFNEESVISETTNHKAPVDSTPAAGTEIIALLLKKYGFLTRKLINRCLTAEKHGTIDTVKTLRKMQQLKVVEKYTIKGQGDDLSVFCLTKESRERYPDERGYKYDMSDIPYILETLSAAQWSISLKNEKAVRELIHEEYITDRENIFLVPSLIKFSIIPGRNLHLLAFPVCRSHDPESLREFLSRLDTANRYFRNAQVKYSSLQPVLICESHNQIEDMSRMLTNITSLARQFYLYTTDSITGNENINPLEMLYGADALSNGNVELSIYSLKELTIRDMAEKAISSAKNKISEAKERFTETF